MEIEVSLTWGEALSFSVVIGCEAKLSSQVSSNRTSWLDMVLFLDGTYTSQALELGLNLINIPRYPRADSLFRIMDSQTQHTDPKILSLE